MPVVDHSETPRLAPQFRALLPRGHKLIALHPWSRRGEEPDGSGGGGGGTQVAARAADDVPARGEANAGGADEAHRLLITLRELRDVIAISAALAAAAAATGVHRPWQRRRGGIAGEQGAGRRPRVGIRGRREGVERLAKTATAAGAEVWHLRDTITSATAVTVATGLRRQRGVCGTQGRGGGRARVQRGEHVCEGELEGEKAIVIVLLFFCFAVCFYNKLFIYK